MNTGQFHKYRALITGASGFIGFHLRQRLRQNGAEVHAVYRAYAPCHSDDLHWWQGDLVDVGRVREILTAVKPDIIFHLASHVAGARDLGLVLPMFGSNLMSTVNLLTVAKEIGCHRIILTGSLEEPKSKDLQAVPSSPYAAAKWASTGYARMFHALYHLPIVILRIFMVYGPAQRDVRKLIPYVILALLRGETPKLSSGERKIDWVYVDDVVDGLLAAAQVRGAEGQTFDIGSGNLVKIREVVWELVNMINPHIKPEFGALPDRPLEQVQVADTSGSWSMFNWRPQTSLPDGLRKTINWYEAQLHKGAI